LRVFVISAPALLLALAVAGCSRPVPPHSALPCTDLRGMACASRPVDGQPMPLAPRPRAVASHGKSTAAAVRRRPVHHHARGGVIKRGVAGHDAVEKARSRDVAFPKARPSAPQAVSLQPKPAQSEGADREVARAGNSAPPNIDNKIDGRVDGKTDTKTDIKTETNKVQDQVGVAAGLAERMTAIAAPRVAPTNDQAKVQPDARLVAVLMTRPGVKTLSELRGRAIAIDERYAASLQRVATGMGAVGASDVQLLDGQSTAINRLTNGEVVAAVVALVSPEAADAFPELSGFRLFLVPLPAR